MNCGDYDNSDDVHDSTDDNLSKDTHESKWIMAMDKHIYVNRHGRSLDCKCSYSVTQMVE